MPSKGIFFDNTRLKDHRNCRRYYYLRHELGWTIEGSSLPLGFGGSWHSAMDSIWANVCTNALTDKRQIIDEAYEAFLTTWKGEYGLLFDEELPPDQIDMNLPRTNGVALNMIAEYVTTRWEFMQECKLVAVEKPFAVPMPNNPNVHYVGRLDKVIRYRGDLWVLEHKTSSLYKKDGPFRNDFVDSFMPNSQVDGYIYAGSMMFGERIFGCMIDGALVHKTVHDGFQLIPIVRNDTAIDAWLHEASQEVSEIFWEREIISKQDISRDKFLKAFRKNSENCMGKYGPCMYLPLCKMSDNPEKDWKGTPPGMITKRWEPFEFYKLQNLGYENGEEIV